MRIRLKNFRCYDDETFDFGEEGLTLLSGSSGKGKCLGENTNILLHDGNIKKVQDIKIGDKLMGDDSTPRTVLSICEGVDTLYKIIPLKGKPYIVNSVHILSLKGDKPYYFYSIKRQKWIVNYMNNSKKICKFFNDKKDAVDFYIKLENEPVNDICIQDYLKLHKKHKKYNYTYHTSVEFNVKNVPLEPYFLGLWLGNRIKYKKYFLKQIEELNLYKNEHIPYIYKTNSKEKRLKLLAGIIDSNGHNKKYFIQIIEKEKKLAKDIEYVALSLGFMIIIKLNKISSKYIIKIYGENINEIPVHNKYIRLHSIKKIKQANVHRFNIKKDSFGKYYGFELDGNGRFLLDDFKVTHNTSIILGIYFALFGSGTKVTSYGKTNCMVELEFDGIKIMRTKRPNRVVVNDIYEDEAAQSIINNKFGDTFDTTGYIAQNALNSFVLMSPIDKLEFLEKFAFKDVNLGEMKNRCKSLINEKHDSLLASVSQLEMATEIFKNLTEPEKVQFPLKCKKSDKEKAIKNEEVKYKNCNILIKRVQKENLIAIQQLNDFRIFNASINSKMEYIQNIDKNILDLQSEQKQISYEGDNQLENYKNRLVSILTRKKIVLLEDRLNNDEIKLVEMKDNESKEYINELSTINSTLWKEYNKEELIIMINDYNQVLKDAEQISQLSKELNKYNVISIENINIKKQELEKYIKDLDVKKTLLDIFKLQREVYSCPSCNVNLRFKEEKLFLANQTTIISDIDFNILTEEINTLRNLIKKLEIFITEEQRKYERYIEIQNKINNILNNYEEPPNLISTQEDLEYLNQYKSSQIQLENRKKILEKSILEEKFSPSYILFYNNICNQKIVIKDLHKKIGKNDENLSEEDLRTIINIQQQNKNKLDDLIARINGLYEEKNKYSEQIKTLQNEYKNKYQTIQDEELLLDIVKQLSIKISNLEQHKVELEDNMLKILKYKQYEKDLENYLSWKNKIETLKKKEIEDKNQYASATLLKEKILEAESISMLNIISSINTHAQLYLDCFFVDNPIIVHLLPFKDTKKSKKPQINIEIEYKGMECDLSMLSGGELSRVILAYTLALGEMFNTPLLLLDECTASLDQDMTTRVFNSIRQNFTGKLVLIIAHQVITGIFDKTIVLGNT